MIRFYGLMAGNKARTEVLSLASPTYCSPFMQQFNHVFAILISMPRFKSINFDQTSPEIK